MVPEPKAGCPAQDRLERRNDVGGFGDERCALFEKTVGAFGAGIEWGAGHREHLAPLFDRKRAVISEPERRAASTTTTPSERPEISRLRRGKSRARGSQPNGISEIAAPCTSNLSSSSMCSGG